jgi:hypothetical protein
MNTSNDKPLTAALRMQTTKEQVRQLLDQLPDGRITPHADIKAEQLRQQHS